MDRPSDRQESPARPEIVLFGGSFNPPHVAHLLAGAYVLATRDCSLWLMPCASHPFGKPLAPFAERRELCALLAGLLGPRAGVTAIEGELGGEGRTIDTVLALQARHPAARFRLLVGADVLHERHQWKRWDELCRLAPPILLGREGYPPPSGFTVELTLPRVSSSEVRRLLAAGEPVEQLVPRPVLERLRARGLYGCAAAPAGPATPLRLAILGLGRAGLTLALALRRGGREPWLLWERDEGRAAAVAGLLGREVASGPPPAALRQAAIWLLAVPDGALAGLAGELAAAGLARGEGQTALHLAGALDHRSLAPLAGLGVAVGSLHPLRALPDPLQLPAGQAEAHAAATLAGAAFAVEAEAGPGLLAAGTLVAALGGLPCRVRPGGKAAYHAAAVLASNAVTALLHEAARVGSGALAEPERALPLLLGLARGALDEVALRGAAVALTGPIVRGDAGTVALHLEALRGDRAAELYRALAGSTVALAREAGIATEALAEIEELLGR